MLVEEKLRVCMHAVTVYSYCYICVLYTVLLMNTVILTINVFLMHIIIMVNNIIADCISQ